MDRHHHASADAENLAQVGRATLSALRERSAISKFFGRERVELRESLTELLASVQRSNPVNWTEDDFSEIGEMMASVIEKLERYQTTDGDNDLALCTFIGTTVKTLRDAQSWIAQGLSPDPQKRPSDAERRERAEQRAATSLRDLFA